MTLLEMAGSHRVPDRRIPMSPRPWSTDPTTCTWSESGWPRCLGVSSTIRAARARSSPAQA